MKQILVRYGYYGYIRPEILLKKNRGCYWWSEGFGIINDNFSKWTKGDVRRNIKHGNFRLFREL